jgi:DNA-binding MarR family transcriptional regulator
LVPPDPTSDRPADKGFGQDGLQAWLGFRTVHAKVVRRLDALLAASYRMTLNEFEVLLKLEIAGGRLRMSDLAQAALLSRSGLTRIVDELEAQQLVVREPDDDDGRVLVAKLTRRGRARFNAARRAHVANVNALFLGPLTAEQRRGLGAAWAAIEQALPETPDERESPRMRRSQGARGAAGASVTGGSVRRR